MRPVPASILDRIGAGLHRDPSHPLGIVKALIHGRLPGFSIHDDLHPAVTVAQNFDSLLIPDNHPARSDSDSYYLSPSTLLRTHTSAHQADLLAAGLSRFVVTGDVFRRDEVDATHSPVFHQMEGVGVVGPGTDPAVALRATLDDVLDGLFPDAPRRWSDSSFPFTDPSWECEVYWSGRWVEILGCGVVRSPIMAAAGRPGERAWAFGIGLERVAMIRFGIPDIRLFWTADRRFRDQFRAGEIAAFRPYSNHPACLKDIAFWVGDGFIPNDWHALVRDAAADLVESVALIDRFAGRDGKVSHCYRLAFRSHERTLTNEEINGVMAVIRAKVPGLGVVLR